MLDMHAMHTVVFALLMVLRLAVKHIVLHAGLSELLAPWLASICCNQRLPVLQFPLPA
jgi:hypothetical protein